MTTAANFDPKPYAWKLMNGSGRDAPTYSIEAEQRLAQRTPAQRQQDEPELLRSLARAKRQPRRMNQTQRLAADGLIPVTGEGPASVAPAERDVIQRRRQGQSFTAIATALRRPDRWVRETELSVRQHLRQLHAATVPRPPTSPLTALPVASHPGDQDEAA